MDNTTDLPPSPPSTELSGSVVSPGVIKSIIERDYSDVTKVCFLEACPVRIRPLVDPEIVINTVKEINKILEDLTKYGGASEFFQNLVSILTLYLANPLIPHGSKKCLDQLTAYIEQQNKDVYVPRGLRLLNPVQHALLQLEFHVISQ